MKGARFVHDQLELAGWQVEIADAQKVKGLTPLACKLDKIDSWVLAELSRRDLVPAIWLPTPTVRAERERAPFAATPGPPPHRALAPAGVGGAGLRSTVRLACGSHPCWAGPAPRITRRPRRSRPHLPLLLQPEPGERVLDDGRAEPGGDSASTTRRCARCSRRSRASACR
jgi:hypothetical protein